MAVKTKIAGLMVVLMALSVPMVYADNGAGMGEGDSHKDGDWHHHGNPEHMLAKILNLSEDQEKQLKDLHEKQRQDRKSTFEQIKANREAFQAEIVKAAPDMNKVNDLQNQLKTIQAQMIDNHLNSLLAVKKIMTPEQFAGYMALKRARQMMMHHRKFDHEGQWGKDGHKPWGAGMKDKDHPDNDQD